MEQNLNIPVPAAAYRQPRLVLKNRRARRNRSLFKPDLNLVGGTQSTRSDASIEADQDLVDVPPNMPPQDLDPGTTVEASTEQANIHLSQAVLLDWLGSQPVAFHRHYVDISGSVTAAVWLSLVLSLLDGRGKDQVNEQGVFSFRLSSKACEAQTGLTDAEQRKAHRQLTNGGVLKVVRVKSVNQGLSFELDMNVLTQRLLAHSEGMAALIQRNEAFTPQLDVAALERQAKLRASRRQARA